jgi:hypothetical protein
MTSVSSITIGRPFLLILALAAACSTITSQEEGRVAPETNPSTTAATTTTVANTTTNAIEMTTTSLTESTTTETPASSGIDPSLGPCDLVEDQTMSSLSKAEVVVSLEANRLDIPTCQYTFEGGSRAQVISVPAEQWAKQLAPILAELERSPLVNDEVNSRKIAEMGEILNSTGTPDACELFTLLAAVQGSGADLTQTVNLVPTLESPQAINGQQCTNGVYTSVQLIASDITDNGDFYNRVVDALDDVHSAGIEVFAA